MNAKELPDIVDVYWVQGMNGHRQIPRGEAIVSPDMRKYNRLFETGRAHVVIEKTNYLRTVDEAVMKDQDPTVHLRYQKQK